MTVEVWMGEEYEFGHEAKAFMSFVEKMVSTYGSDQNLYMVLANFIINSSPIDLAVIKKNRIFVIELKEVGGAVFGGENGSWKVVFEGKTLHEVHGGSHGNPYLQVRDYRYSLIRFLGDNQARFLKNRAGTMPDWAKAIGTVAAFSPTLAPESRIDIPAKPWFQAIGLDELHLKIYRDRINDFSLLDQEMHQLVEQVMHLSPVPLNKIIKSDPAPEIPHDSVPSIRIANEPVTSHAVVATVNPVTEACFVCDITSSKCQQPTLKGSLQNLRSDESQKVIVLNISQDESVEIKAKDDWAEKLTRLVEKLPRGGQVTLAFQHLYRGEQGTYIPNDDSLMIMEPDWLINVTDLTKVEYCHRQLLLERYIPAAPNEAMIRGNVVHQLFSAIWSNPNPASLNAETYDALSAQSVGMATSGTDPLEIEKAVVPHIQHISLWAGRQTRKSELRSETFMLSPLLGMKGRIDVMWELDNRPVVLGELKTGKSQGAAPKPEHELQITSYALMLFARGDVSYKGLVAFLLYSGNENLGGDGRNLPRRIVMDMAKFLKTVNVRNELVLIDYTGNARFETNLNKCTPCRLNADCARVALLREQTDPRKSVTTSWIKKGASDFSSDEKHFFQHYADLLMDELRQVKKNHAALWTTSKEDREKEGKAFRIASTKLGANGNAKRLQYRFHAPNDRNTSEIRVGDSVIISGVNGPGFGKVALGSVVGTTSSLIEVQTNEELRFEPGWLDLYTDENLTERLFAGLYRWMIDSGRQRQLIIGEMMPSFSTDISLPRVPLKMGDRTLNEKQQLVVEMSVRTNDYLLVLGPPGSGKTTLIEQIVRTHLAMGRRILLAAGTNRAIDEVLKKLVRTEFADNVIRLGSDATASPDLASWTLNGIQAESNNLASRVKHMRQALIARQVVGATVSTLLSGNFDSVLGRFDLVIVDEAAQLTLPATLGVLRFGERFLLIGDNHQLPAVVQSETRNMRDRESGSAPINQAQLSQSLFDTLRNRLEKNNRDGLVKLTEQYRMNKVICDIPSELWYESDLKPANSAVANGRLQVFTDNDDRFLDQIMAIEKPVIFVDVPVDGSAGPRTNYAEAKWIEKIISNYIRIGLKPEPHEKGGDGQIGVISPFRAQVAQIRRVLENSPDRLLSPDVIRKCVDTVDRFQGSERDLIILSLASSSGPLNDLLKDERRLNVAITRSKHKLIILGNYHVLAHDPTFYTLLKTIQEKVDYKDWCVSVEA